MSNAFENIYKSEEIGFLNWVLFDLFFFVLGTVAGFVGVLFYLVGGVCVCLLAGGFSVFIGL